MSEHDAQPKDKGGAAGFDQLLSDIFAQYRPSEKPVPDYEPTSVELARAISQTAPVTPTGIAIHLTLRGFKVKRVGTEFRWQMDFVE